MCVELLRRPLEANVSAISVVGRSEVRADSREIRELHGLLEIGKERCEVGE